MDRILVCGGCGCNEFHKKVTELPTVSVNDKIVKGGKFELLICKKCSLVKTYKLDQDSSIGMTLNIQ